MVKILGKIWKLYRKGIVSSALVVLLIVSLLYISSVQGKFVWFPNAVKSAYDIMTPEFSIYSVVLSFVVLLLLFLYFYMKNK